MCSPGISPRSDETIVPVRVSVSPTEPRIGIPGSNNFKVRRKPNLSLPPTALRPSTIRSLSEPSLPSPTKMEQRKSSAPSSIPAWGSNKPLPISPTSEYGPPTGNGGSAMHHYLPSPRELPLGLSPTASSNASDPEAIRILCQKLEAHAKLLEKQGRDHARLERKVDELSNWTQEQFTDLVARFGNMSQANSDMFAKQTQLSYEIAKSRLDMKSEMKNELHEMRTEINGLTASFSDLNAKVDICLQRLWDNSDETFVEHQCRRNERVDEDIQDMRNQLDYIRQLVIRVRVGLTLAQPSHALSYTPESQQRPITNPAAVLASSSPQDIHPTKRVLSKQISTPQFSTKRSPSKLKLTSGLLRSASTTASAFRAAKEAIDKRDISADNNTRWGFFGRRRHDASDASSSNSKPNRPGRRMKEGEDTPIPPVPCIPEGIARLHGDTKTSLPVAPQNGHRLSLIHPLFRPSTDSPGAGSPFLGTPEKLSPILPDEPDTAIEKNALAKKESAAENDDFISLPSTYASSPAQTRNPPSPNHGSSRSNREDIPK